MRKVAARDAGPALPDVGAPRRLHVVVSGPEHYPGLIDDQEDGWTEWTVDSGALPRDQALFYFTDPMFAVAGRARVTSKPEPYDDPGCTYHGKPMAKFDDIVIFPVHLPLAALKLCFPPWGFWLQPRNNITVPDEHSDQLALLAEHFIAPRRTPASVHLPAVNSAHEDRRQLMRAVARVRKHRQRMLAGLCSSLRLPAFDCAAYVAWNAHQHEAMTFDESLCALAEHSGVAEAA